MEKLIIERVVAYMLKVMKSGVDITKFQDEFASIRHGNYDDFIDLVKGEKPFMIVWQEGAISNQYSVSQKTHCDFAALALAGPSLKKFFNQCRKEYGDDYMRDNDEISNDVYNKVVLFEIGLRMHANNNKLLQDQERLIDVINKLCSFKNIAQEEIDKLQKGRQFINDIKHYNDSGYNRKFATWEEGILVFEEAYKVVESYKFTVI